MKPGCKICRYLSKSEEKHKTCFQQNDIRTNWRGDWILAHMHEANERGVLERNCDFRVWACIWTSLLQICSLNRFLLGTFLVPGFPCARDMDFTQASNCIKPPKQELQEPSHFLTAFLWFPIKCQHLMLIWRFTPNLKLQNIMLHSWWSGTRRKN